MRADGHRCEGISTARPSPRRRASYSMTAGAVCGLLVLPLEALLSFAFGAPSGFSSDKGLNVLGWDYRDLVLVQIALRPRGKEKTNQQNVMLFKQTMQMCRARSKWYSNKACALAHEVAIMNSRLPSTRARRKKKELRTSLCPGHLYLLPCCWKLQSLMPGSRSPLLGEEDTCAGLR